jgi:hypothetical protein
VRTTTAPAGTIAQRVRARRAPYVAVAGVVALVVITAVWGSWLDRLGEGISLHAAPLFGAWQPRVGFALLGPLVVAALVVWRGPSIAEELGWRRLLASTFVAATAWGLALALVDVDGLEGLVRGVSSPVDFLAVVDRIESPRVFLDTFTERIDDYVVHVRGHPPVLGIVLSWMARIGLGGAAAFAGLVIAAGAAAIVGALVTVREVADEATARAAAPFLVLSPAAIWLVTSADALYAGLGAIGVAALVMATGRTGARANVLAAAGGLVLGIALFFSYGLVLVLPIPFVVAVARRRLRPLLVAGVVMVCVGTAIAGFGFSWIEGLWATRAEYVSSVAALRPYGYFVLANLAAFAIALGPAPVAGIAKLRDRRLWLLVGAVLIAVAAADVSGLSKGEVERIWLPFWPWVTIASAALASRARWWLAAQAGVAVGIQTLIGTPW